MKQVKNVLTLVVLLIALSARADGERKTLLFNFDWKFKLGEVQNAESPAFDDADWRRLDLPHAVSPRPAGRGSRLLPHHQRRDDADNERLRAHGAHQEEQRHTGHPHHPIDGSYW